mgnify:CR=1 FL=1
MIESIQTDPNFMHITWNDGVKSQFHFQWLRENCHSSSTRHPGTHQRLLEYRDYPDDLAPIRYDFNHEKLSVTWNHNQHHSEYSFQWLRKHSNDAESRKQRKFQPKLWKPAQAEYFAIHDYPSITTDDKAKFSCLSDFLHNGFVRIANAPNVDGTVVKTISLFGFVRETNYGKYFEVWSEANPEHLANSNRALSIHTDNLYRLSTPSVQALHCLNSSMEGGESTMVDGFRAAEDFRKDHPELFEHLLRIPVAFTYSSKSEHLYQRKPLISVDYDGVLQTAFINERVMAPLDLPAVDQKNFYDAFRVYQCYVYDPAYTFTFKMNAGDIMIFNNHRMFHGRKAIQPQKEGKRHLQGCYGDIDGFFSRYRVLAREFAPENGQLY